MGMIKKYIGQEGVDHNKGRINKAGRMPVRRKVGIARRNMNYRMNAPDMKPVQNPETGADIVLETLYEE